MTKFHKFMPQEEIQEQVSVAMIPHIKVFLIKIIVLLSIIHYFC